MASAEICTSQGTLVRNARGLGVWVWVFGDSAKLEVGRIPAIPNLPKPLAESPSGWFSWCLNTSMGGRVTLVIPFDACRLFWRWFFVYFFEDGSSKMLQQGLVRPRVFWSRTLAAKCDKNRHLKNKFGWNPPLRLQLCPGNFEPAGFCAFQGFGSLYYIPLGK